MQSLEKITNYFKKASYLPQFVSVDRLLYALHLSTQTLWQTPGQWWADSCKLTHQLFESWHQAWHKVECPTETLLSSTKDKRFQHHAWHEHPFFSMAQQNYTILSDYLQQKLAENPSLQGPTKRQALFYLNQLLDALAPSNFPLTNPEIISKTCLSEGRNLWQGFNKWLEDMDAGNGLLRISTNNERAFTLGENIAATPGDIVYQNELVQLIRYRPTTSKVYQVPLLIIAPWINRYYIFDLQQQNSFVRWAVDQGFQVFITSWVNPGPELHDKSFEDYIQQGVFESIHAIRMATGAPHVNAIGYCIGGTLLSSAMAYLAAHNQPWISSATLLTTLLDFQNAGDLSLLLEESQIHQIEEYLAQFGNMDAQALNQMFSLLASNNMVWANVVRNYFLGQEPPTFDILYWNSQPTRLTASCLRFILRELYQKNTLAQSDGFKLADTQVDLRQIKTPLYFLSTKDDHIAPWTATYANTQFLQAPMTFVLAGSGHTAGVMNPPSANKYQYWTNAALVNDPNQWFKDAQRHTGSWWPHWRAWVKTYAGFQIPARGSWDFKSYPRRGRAPGSYATQK